MSIDYRVVRSVSSDRDLSLIFDVLYEGYLQLGQPIKDALTLAARRLHELENEMATLGKEPGQGRSQYTLIPGLRCVTKQLMAIYFLVDDSQRTVRILAVLYGAHADRRRMLIRLAQVDR